MSSTERAPCALTHDVLDAWLDGRPGRHAAHVGGCAACAAAIGGYERLSAVLRSDPSPEPPAGACAAVLGALPALKPLPPAHGWVATRVLAPAVALCVLAVAFGSWLVVSQTKGAVSGGVHWRAGHQPIPDAWVVLLQGEEVVAVTSTSALRGGFRFEDLRPGRYDALPFSACSVLPAPVSVQIEPNHTARLPLFLDSCAPVPPTGTPVHVQIADDRGAPVEGALTVLVQGGRVPSIASANAQGRSALLAPEAGPLTVWCYAPGYDRASLDTTLPPSGTPIRLDLKLRRR